MRPPREQGFTLIETLVAITVLAVGMLATATVYDGSRGLTGVAERTSVMAHRAQAEIERIQALGWAHVALSGTPVPSSDPASPASMLAGGSPPLLRPDRRAPTTTEPLVIDPADGGVAPTSRTWSDGRLTGRVWTWVSWRTDPRCGAGCTAARGGKRVTVVVTTDGTGHGRGPLVTSVVLTDPNAAPAGAMQNGARNPLSDPATVCVSSSGTDVPCSRSIGTGSATSWFLYDTPAKGTDQRVAVTADHVVHQTVLGTGLCTLVALLGCPVPDLMGDEPPPSGTTIPPLLDRSSGTSGSEQSGGRVLRVAETGCATAPAPDNARSARWVTPAQPDGATLTGEGGMTLYTRTRTGVAARVVLCVQLAVSPGPVGELLTLPPTVLATLTYELSAWPAVMTPVSFSFSVPGADLVVAAGKRIAVRVWLAASSASDVVIAYDHPSLQSVLQLNVR